MTAGQRSRYGHIYVYVRDEVLGPIAMCVGALLERVARMLTKLIKSRRPTQ